MAKKECLEFNVTPGQEFSHFETNAVHGGFDPDIYYGGPVVLPITTSTTYTPIGGEPGTGRFKYSRVQSPTRQSLEGLLASIEGSKYALAFSSGLSAADAVFHMLNSGDHVLCMDDVYSGTHMFFKNLVPRHNIEVTFVDLSDLNNLQENLRPNTKLVWVETPSNPTMKLVDIAASVALVKKLSTNVLYVVDNTFATPYFQHPLQLGADLSIQSVSKYINGHCDVLMGSIALNDDTIYNMLKGIQTYAGPCSSPFDCYLVWRGIKTLALRMRKHMENGLILAKHLEGHPMVERVMHPGLPSHPQHELAKRQMRGYPGVFSFYLRGGVGETKSLLKSVKIFFCAGSLGGVESLIQCPALQTHSMLPKETLNKLGVTESLIRVSVGIEDADDLIADLEQALETVKKTFSG